MNKIIVQPKSYNASRMRKSKARNLQRVFNMIVHPTKEEFVRVYGNGGNPFYKIFLKS